MNTCIKDTPFFKDCRNKIELMCKKALKEKYQKYEGRDLTLDDFIGDCHGRLLDELEGIDEGGFCYEIWIYKTIWDFAVSKKCAIDICGDLETSYVAYLLGMIEEDPFQWLMPRRYPFRFLIDGHPYVYIVAPELFKKELTEFFKGIFGKDKVTTIEDYIILGNIDDIEGHETLNTIWIHII